LGKNPYLQSKAPFWAIFVTKFGVFFTKRLVTLTNFRADRSTGWPDVFFQNKNPNLGKFWEGLGIENVGIFYDNWQYFTAIWYSLLLFGKFFLFWYV
jgi:hypothetical protein